VGCSALHDGTGETIEFGRHVDAVQLNSGKTYPYGFGWSVAEAGGKRVVSHDGAWQGFTMSIVRHVDDRLTIIVMTNLDEDNSKSENIAKDVGNIYLK
jgi:hypothetical protein